MPDPLSAAALAGRGDRATDGSEGMVLAIHKKWPRFTLVLLMFLAVAPIWRHDRYMGTNHTSAAKDRLNLRITAELRAAVEAACSGRPGKVSINTWVTEAIAEKLEREEAPKVRRAANG